MATPLRPDRAPMTLAQFLAWDEHQPLRHEFFDGVPHAMTGSTNRHNVIVDNVLDALRGPARGAGCRAHGHNTQIRTPSDRVYYPDVVVGCGPFGLDDLQERGPCMVVEVTSPSTRAVDHGRKLRDCQSMPSLQAYVVVEQAMQRLECHVRQADGSWAHTEVSGATGLDQFVAPCGGGVLRLAEVYAETDVPAPPPGLLAPPDVAASSSEDLSGDSPADSALPT